MSKAAPNPHYQETLRNQLSAADPGLSAWVGASAGSGKTKVLSDRVLRLLLAEGQPTRILCLTFTKAAAAEMERRIAERLSNWTALPEGKLQLELQDLLGRLPEQGELSAARSLFAKMLDAPGGLKVQTIHSFCQSVLARFPLEARVTPNFETLDERSAKELLGLARDYVLERLQQGGTPALEGLRQALPDVVTYLHELDFARLVDELIGARETLSESVGRLGGLEMAAETLYQRLGLQGGELPESVLAKAAEPEAYDPVSLEMIAEALEGGGKNDQKHAAAIRRWLAAPSASAEAFFDYCSAYFTKGGAGEAYKEPASKGVRETQPAAMAAIESEIERLEAVRARYFAALEARLSSGLLRMAHATLLIYEDLKQTAAALDYDDQIIKVRDLLAADGLPSWVLYKLDGGIDHLLLDEAQDTSPAQWEVIGALIEEFFDGEGPVAEARRQEGLSPRSLFTVGDPKQSIYGFQGARPDLFAAKRELYREQARDAGVSFQQVPLDMSFRSTEAVLKTVDAVFAPPERHAGVVFQEVWRSHKAYRNGHAGLVELWPPLEPRETEAADPWEPAEGQGERDQPRRRLAELLAERIHHWTASQEGADDPESFLESQGRRLEAGDIMLLVRRRNAFVSELVRALKTKGVKVAGVDRMKLMEQLPIMDLVAFGNFLLLPEDDLTLAVVLKSPLVGLDEEQLFELAYGRGGKTLWQRLREKGKEGGVFAEAAGFLKEQLARADYDSPFTLYARLLGEKEGRRKMLARLGPEAADPLDEFLALAQDYAQQHPPSLQGFLHWLGRDQREVKRDLEQTEGAVRIMTVHAAKGLQAPFVILPDTLGSLRNDRSMLWSEGEEAGGQGALPLPFFPLPGDQKSPIAARAEAARRAREAEEKRRLLYVAMTRAEDRLLVCGWNGQKKGGDPEPWHRLVEEGLGRLREKGETVEEREISFPEQGLEGTALRFSNPQSVPAEDKRKQAAAKGGQEPLPDWAREDMPEEPTPAKPLNPSRPSGVEPASLSPLGEEAGWRFKRGNLVHRLLQSLPDLPREGWDAAAARYLGQRVHGLSEEERAALWAETRAVLDSPKLADLFGPGSRAEVPVSGLEKNLTISGQVDRLVVTPKRVDIIDYKTNRPAPRTTAEVPEIYWRQMASYRALLKRVYEGRIVRCFLLWTEAPRLMELEQETLDAIDLDAS
ncbi:double-strand break repair helicase AddA [Limibacillus halophilus]